MKIDRRRPEDEMRECEVIFARTLSSPRTIVKTRGRVHTPDRCSSSISDQDYSPTTEEVGGQKSEVGGQRSEVGGQRSEVGGQKPEVGGQRAEEARKGGFTVYTDSLEQFRPEKAYCVG